MAKFRPGQSGNPQGRPRGTSKAAKLRKAIEGDLAGIITAMVDAAKDGDTAAAKLLLDRAIPALKPIEQPAYFPHAETLGQTGEAILAAASAGTLAPGQAAQLVSAVGGLARVREMDELAERINTLEEKIDGKYETTS